MEGSRSGIQLNRVTAKNAKSARRRFVRIQQTWRNGCSLTEAHRVVSRHRIYRELLDARESRKL